MVKIAPSILASDFANLASEIKKVERHANLLHIDVMDGRFVPNITIGPAVVESIRKASKLFFDVHLMIENPEKHVESFAKAGADSISVHIEAKGSIKKAIQLIKSAGKKAAIVINPDTKVRKIEKYLSYIDMVLVMSVYPGFGGQKFIEGSIQKIEELAKLRKEKSLSFEIEVDGGINAETAKLAKNAGADILVAGSYIYNSKNIAAAIKQLKQ